MFGKDRAIVAGILLSLFGGLVLWTRLSHSITGIETTATILATNAECTVEYQLVTDAKRTVRPLDCDSAEAFQNRIGDTKVILHRTNYLTLRYQLQDGAIHEAKADAAKVHSYKAIMQAGKQIPVVYDPRNPDDLQAPLSFAEMVFEAGLLFVGLTILAFSFGLNPVSLLRTSSARKETQSQSSAEEAMLAAVSARMAAQAAAATRAVPPSFASSSAPTFGRRGSAAAR